MPSPTPQGRTAVPARLLAAGVLAGTAHAAEPEPAKTAAAERLLEAMRVESLMSQIYGRCRRCCPASCRRTSTRTSARGSTA